MSENCNPQSRGPIALFFPKLEPGGAERVMLDLARGLHERGREVDVVLGSTKGGLSADLPPGVNRFELGAERLRYGTIPLIRYVRQRRPACLIATLDHAGVLAMTASTLSRTHVPVIVRVANTLSEKRATATTPAQKVTSTLASLMYPRVDLIVAPSEGVAQDLRSFLKSPGLNVRVIPNPVIRPEVFELARMPVSHSWFQPGAPPVILAAGRLVPQKDFETLIRAVAFVAPAVDCRLVILGEGPLRGSLQALARELGVEDRCDMPGFEPNPFAFMSKAAVFALSSRYEGLPAVLIQALACGAPVVATDCPSGPAEILDGGRYGELVPVGDPELLAKAIHIAITGPRRPPDATAWRRYSFDESVGRYEAAIGEVRRG